MSDNPNFVPVKSSMLAGYEHDPNTRTLIVTFNNGARYQYDDVGVDKVQTMAESASPGSFFNSRIKGLHPGVKL
jgi:KTSC domain-containing protein